MKVHTKARRIGVVRSFQSGLARRPTTKVSKYRISDRTTGEILSEFFGFVAPLPRGANMKKKSARNRSAQDLTLINLHALKKRVEKLEVKVSRLERRK